MATEEQDIQALKQRLLQRYPAGTSTGTPATVTSLTTALARIQQQGEHQRPLTDRLLDMLNADAGMAAPGPEHQALLAWVDDAVAIMLRDYALDENIAAKIQGLLPLMGALAINQEEFLHIGEHPAHKIIDTIYSHCLGWHPGLGRTGQFLLEELEAAEASALEYLHDRDKNFDEILQRLNKFLAAEIPIFERMQTRAIQAEEGKLKVIGAQATAARALNERMAGSELPAGVVEFLQGCWYDSMQLALVSGGTDSAEWSRMLKATDMLLWTVQPFDSADEKRRQELYRLITQLPRELRLSLISLQGDEHAQEAATAPIEEVHFKILQNSSFACENFELLHIGAGNAATSVSTLMLEQLNGLRAGDWFRIEAQEGVTLRVRLALKMDEYKQLLFVNRAGIKALQKTFEEFAYLLSSGVAKPLPLCPALSLSLQEAAGLIQADATEASASARPQRRRHNTPSAADEDGTTLAIGSWVKFSDGDVVQVCKLAAHIRADDTLLFVNEQGVKRRELDAASLAALQESGQCELISDDSVFAKTVSRVVHSYRRADSGEIPE